jgi:nucleotide-binding universal stress UspA family protein
MYPYSLTRPIVVAVDGSSHSDAAVKWAADESVLRNAPVKLVHAVAPMLEPMGRPGPMPEMHRWYHDNAKTVLFESEALFRARRDDSRNIDVETALVESSVVPAVIKASEGAQLIVVGSRGLGHLSRLMLGSVSTSLIHHAHCPVAVIPHPDEREGTDRHPVLLGIDGSTASEAATELAFDEASRRGVERRGRPSPRSQRLVVRPPDRGARTVGPTPSGLAGEVSRCARRPARRMRCARTRPGRRITRLTAGHRR